MESVITRWWNIRIANALLLAFVLFIIATIFNPLAGGILGSLVLIIRETLKILHEKEYTNSFESLKIFWNQNLEVSWHYGIFAVLTLIAFSGVYIFFIKNRINIDISIESRI